MTSSFFSVLGEGMGGSLFWQDLISLAHSIGFSTPHLVSASQIVVYNRELNVKAGNKRDSLT